MNTQKKSKFPTMCSRMVFRLWLIMMSLVIFAIIFMWIVQVFLFERNYLNMELEETRTRMEPVMENLATEDLASDEKLFSYLSWINSGDTFLVDGDGNILIFYSYGRPSNPDDPHMLQMMRETIAQSEGFQDLKNGKPYEKVDKDGSHIRAFELGLPVTYNEERCYLIMHHPLMLDTTLKLNRKQLTTLTILLTITASILSAVLSRQFTRPIYTIKKAIDRLANNDFSARPDLKRQDELGDLSRSVEQLGKKLSQVDVLRKELIANISHELRSPLALISGYAEMVRDISWHDDAMREDNLNLIIHEARRMSEMVSDILDYSQLQAGYIQLKKDWYNLYDIVESEVYQCSREAAEHEIQIQLESCDTDIPFLADALKISQVVRNLLNNAINHTKEKETIFVRIERLEQNCRVSVINPGPPIPEEEREIIWERYQRSQHQNGRRSGTGIGLSIVSTILNAHQMNFGIDCKDGTNIFWFECPTNPATADAAACWPAENRSSD